MSDYLDDEIIQIENISDFLKKNGFNIKSVNRSADWIEIIEITADKVLDTITFLKNHTALNFDFLMYVSGIDTGNGMQVVYHLYSSIHKINLIIKIEIDRNNPHINSISGIYSAADWHERETYDLLGIEFDNHPSLKRILLPEEWIGHPLRKDYAMNDSRLVWNER